MYISFNDGESWKPFQLNLPIVPITDLTIKDNNLIVATQGRSLWIIDDLTILHQLQNTSTSTVLFTPKDTYRTKGGMARNSKTAGMNHPNGVLTYYYINKLKDKDTVSLTYLSKSGDTIQSYSNVAKDAKYKLKVKEGSNKFVWDMKYKGAEKLKGMILWWAGLGGAKAVPGTYKVSLKVNSEEVSKSFNILKDPRAEVSVADMQKQFDFVSEVNTTIDKAHQSIKKIRKIRSQLEQFEKQYKGNDAVKSLIDDAKNLREALTSIEEALYQTKNRSNQDPLNFPIRLTNKLGHLASLVTIDDYPPTDQDIAVKNEMTKKIELQLSTFNELVDKKVKAFNTSFNNLKLNYLFIEE